ncbi:hypothetical protein AAMO2058_000932200, partial [Amorphochlora amoebiformis]
TNNHPVIPQKYPNLFLPSSLSLSLSLCNSQRLRISLTRAWSTVRYKSGHARACVEQNTGYGWRVLLGVKGYGDVEGLG